MQGIDTVLFDLDGTLVDSIPGILASFDSLVSKHRELAQLDREIVRKHIGRPLSELVLPLTRSEQRTEAILADFRARSRANLPNLKLFPGCLNLLVHLKRHNIKTGLVTSKSRASTLILTSTHGLESLLDVIVAKDDTAVHKPRPEPLLKAMDLLNSRPKTTAYVGDTVHDLDAASAAGCVTVAALWGSQDRSAMLSRSPSWQFESAADLTSSFVIGHDSESAS